MVISLSMWPPRLRPNKTVSRTAPNHSSVIPNGISSKTSSPNPESHHKVGDHRQIPERVWKASSGYLRRVLDGKTYQSDIPLVQHVGVDTRSG